MSETLESIAADLAKRALIEMLEFPTCISAEIKIERIPQNKLNIIAVWHEK